jgi:hypothetical protein
MTPEETLRALRQLGCRVFLFPAPEAGDPIIVLEDFERVPDALKVDYQKNQAAITALLVEESFDQMHRSDPESE